MKDDEKTHEKTINQLITMKKELDKVNKGENSVNNVNKMLSNIEKKKINNFNHDANIEGVLKTDEDDVKQGTKEKSNRSVDNKIKIKDEKLKASSVSDDKNKLFSSEDKNKLEKVLAKPEIDKIERKFEALDHSKQSIQNKHKSDVKVFNKKLSELQERFDFLNLQLKESEQKSKISYFQMNEYKNEQKIYQKKLNEMQGQVDSMFKVIKEKDQENKILLNQLNSLRKIVKHNAVPPMDTEIVKHLEKIKSEECVSNDKDEENEENEEVPDGENMELNNEINNIDNNEDS
jgi:hypothetical protein